MTCLHLPPVFRHTLRRLLQPGLGLLLVSLWLGCPAMAQSDGEANRKIELMSEALRARGQGDLALARDRLEDLLLLAPEDTNVQKLLAAVKDDMAAGLAKPRSAAAGPAVAVIPPSASKTTVPAPLPDSSGGDVTGLAERGRAQFIAGDFDAAQETFGQVEARDPNHPEAKYFQTRIAALRRANGVLDHLKTKEQMLQEVAQGWQRPQIFDREKTTRPAAEDRGLRAKLEQITIPRVSFNGVPLSKVVETLSVLSEEYASDKSGINMVLINPTGQDPAINITLRQLTLNRILDFIVESAGYEYDVQTDAVVIRQGQGQGTRLETDFFPLSRSTIIRLTGIGAKAESGATSSADPFAVAAPSAEGPAAAEGETALRNFLQRAGIPFDSIPGANLALADGQLVVTQTPRNLDKVRNLLRRYSEIKQVEIESRFLEVQQGDLDELGLNWTVGSGAKPLFDPATGNPLLNQFGEVQQGYSQTYNSGNRSLSGAFGTDPTQNRLLVTNGTDTLTDPVSAPTLASGLDIAQTAVSPLAKISGVIGEFDVDVLIRALSRKQGNDLMSAPKVTVLSGKTANITVAQEMRYPQSYGDIQAQVGRGDSGAGGSAGVAITTGTPQDFSVRNVGVEMAVTPTVEDDGAISLLLEPIVTEFEGFVEYGGPSIAIASSTTVKVPSGFFQPIFSVRKVRTEVTIWDGATVVLGGLTREQTITVKDKVPVLGDVPLLGRLFRSEGESSQKRNLLVFVTANLISPGGSPARQQFSTVDPGSLFQNPTIVTPGGAVSRGVGETNSK